MVEVASVEEAERYFFAFAYLSDDKGDAPNIDDVEQEALQLGDWATLDVRLPNYHSEMPSAFIDAYSSIQASLYRLAAFVEYGNADIRNLTSDDLDRYQLVVKVTEGSANFGDNLADIINRIAEAAVGKMNGRQAALTILGIGLLVTGSWGGSAFLESRKEIRIAEIHSEERKLALEALSFASAAQSRQMDEVLRIMRDEGGASKRAADTAVDVQNEVLRAASRVDETEIGGNHVTRKEAQELRGTTRRKSSTEMVEQEMRVVDVNTADDANTTVILEDIDTQQQHRVTFADRTIAAASRQIVIDALAARSTAWFRILRRSVEGDVVSIDIVSVQPMTTDGQAQLPSTN